MKFLDIAVAGIAMGLFSCLLYVVFNPSNDAKFISSFIVVVVFIVADYLSDIKKLLEKEK